MISEVHIAETKQAVFARGNSLARPVAGLLAVLLLAGAVLAQEVTTVWVPPSGNIVAGSRVSVWLHLLNTTPQEVKRTFPTRVDGQVTGGLRSAAVTLELISDSASEAVIPPGGFARREYLLSVPETMSGRSVLEMPAAGSKIVLEIEKSAAVARSEAAPPRSEPSPKPTGSPLSDGADPIDFFKKHLYPHEPFYFIAGTKSPNAKFQVSLKYRLFDPDAGLGQRVPAAADIYLGYTQTSLWDWKQPSAPFVDTSYKPELFYARRGVIETGTNGWFRVDLQGGFQHESNGKDGTSSRSMNFFYLKPTLVFGRERSLQLSLAPRGWVYVFGLDDNPDLPAYRGYADLVATVGWTQSLQLATTFRIGDDGSHTSLMFDLTYPLNRVPWCGLTWYVHAQYFTGYGEAFLNYKERSEVFRLGFSLYR